MISSKFSPQIILVLIYICIESWKDFPVLFPRQQGSLFRPNTKSHFANWISYIYTCMDTGFYFYYDKFVVTSDYITQGVVFSILICSSLSPQRERHRQTNSREKERDRQTDKQQRKREIDRQTNSRERDI